MKQKVIEHVCKEHIYVAEDGTEFKIEAECLRYEKLYERKQYIEKAKKIQIKDLDGTVPLGYGNNAECNYYIWYKLRDQEDINILQVSQQLYVLRFMMRIMMTNTGMMMMFGLHHWMISRRLPKIFGKISVIVFLLKMLIRINKKKYWKKGNI